MKKNKIIYYPFCAMIALVLMFSIQSCENEYNASSSSVEGHWVYNKTKIDFVITDPILEKTVIDYYTSKNQELRISYEFKNDKTYYYYVNYMEPLKGIYSNVDKNIFKIDDSRGIQNMLTEESTLYVISDVKKEIMRKFNISEDKIIKAKLIELFDRGLISN